MDAIVYDKVGKEAEKVREALYGIYPQETITDAAIASFDDGADGIPVKALTVGIEPVQDLHGYNNPWPAGGGKNLLVTTLENLKSVNTSGTWNGNAYTKNGMTFSVQVDDGGNVTGIVLSGTATNTATLDTGRNVTILPAGTYKLSTGSRTNVNYTLYKIVNGSATSLGGITDLTLDEETSIFVRLSAVVGSVTGGTAQLQIESGSTATDFVPYSNICPISGWTGAEIEQTGKNLFNEIYDNISATSAPMYKAIYVGDGDYTLSTTTPLNTGGNTNLFLLPGNVSSGASSGTNGVSIENAKTVTASDGYVTIAYRSYMGVNPQEYKTQLEKGSIATDYEPYTGNQISVTFPSEAGTVYGGTLTLNPDRTGTLVVDKGIIDLGTLAWTKGEAGLYQFFSETNFGASNSTNILCSVFRYGKAYTATEDNVIELRVGTYHRTWVRSKLYSGLKTAEFKTAMSGVQLVYELALPQIIQLTEAEVSGILTTLYGTNNIWANTGNIEKLTYRADLGKYIDSHITTAVANALNA